MIWEILKIIGSLAGSIATFYIAYLFAKKIFYEVEKE